MKRIIRLLLIFGVLIAVVGCTPGLEKVSESSTMDTESNSNNEQNSVSVQQLDAMNNIKARYNDYVNTQEEKGEPVRGEGVEPVFFGYHLIAYHKESGESRYMLKPFTVSFDGKVYLSETQVNGVELQKEDLQTLVADEYLSEGLDLIVPDGKGNEETAISILKSYIDENLGNNDYKIGVIGYVYIFGDFGSPDCLLLSILPKGEGYVAYQQ